MQFQKTNRAAFLNFLRAQYAAWTGAIQVKSYPHYLLVDPSTICQLRCPTCLTGQENESRKLGTNITFRNQTMLAVDLFDALLHELGDYLFQNGYEVQNLYSGLDTHVINQFHRVFKGLDPFLDVAFDLLHDKKRFVEFFRENLINDFSQETPTYSFLERNYAFL